jgi:hypothetical protein
MCAVFQGRLYSFLKRLVSDVVRVARARMCESDRTLRDKSQSPIGGPRIKLAPMGFIPVSLPRASNNPSRSVNRTRTRTLELVLDFPGEILRDPTCT